MTEDGGLRRREMDGDWRSEVGGRRSEIRSQRQSNSECGMRTDEAPNTESVALNPEP